MKKPIDPNLETFEDSVFKLTEETPEGTQQPAPADASFSDPNFVVSEADASGVNPSEYYASENHRQKAASGEIHVPGSSEHHHSSSHRHSSDHQHTSSAHHSSSSSHHSSRRHRHHHRRKHRLPLGARIVIGILIFILVVAVAIAGAFFLLNYKGEKDMTASTVNTDYEETIEYNGHTYVYNENIVSMAFIGVDKRSLGEADSHTQTVGMADTDVVIAIDKVSGKTSMIAVPRDTMVDVDVYEDGEFVKTSEMELCIAYAYGDGFGQSCKNVTKSISRVLYNVPIDKYFAMDLNGIQPINDAVGGVKLTSLYDLEQYGIKKGDEIHLTGDLTEAYVRTRDMDDLNASINRTQRQMQYLNAFADKVKGSVTQDFSILTNLYNTASDYCTTDITLSNATYLASLLLSKGVTGFDSYTLEGTMKAIDNPEFADYVYAGFYPDEDHLMQTVLDVFYTKVK